MATFSAPSKICTVGGIYYDAFGVTSSVAVAASPALTTPTIGAATATSINGMTIASTTTATTIAARNSYANTHFNAMSPGVTSTVTAASTTTLTVGSTQTQIFTGSTTQTLVLPAATTLATGHTYRVVNKSSGSVTVNANGGGLVTTVTASSSAFVYVTDVSTAAGTWIVDVNVTGFGDAVLASTQEFTGINTFSNATASTSSTTGALVVAGMGVAGDIVGGTTTSLSIGANTVADASAILDLTSTSTGMLVPRMTTAQRTSISSPVANLTVYDTDLSLMFVYKTITTTNYYHSGAVDSSITSAAAWFPVNTARRSLGSMSGVGALGTTNWSTTPSGTVTIFNPDTEAWGLHNSNIANGAGLIWTCPVTVPIGVIEIIYSLHYHPDRPIVDTSVSFDNGSSYTPVSTGHDYYNASYLRGMFHVHRYIPNATAGTMKIKFVSNGKNASAGNYYVIVTSLYVNLM